MFSTCFPHVFHIPTFLGQLSTCFPHFSEVFHIFLKFSTFFWSFPHFTNIHIFTYLHIFMNFQRLYIQMTIFTSPKYPQNTSAISHRNFFDFSRKRAVFFTMQNIKKGFSAFLRFFLLLESPIFNYEIFLFLLFHKFKILR